MSDNRTRDALAARRKLAIAKALMVGPMDCAAIARAAAAAGLPLPAAVEGTYPHTLKRIGLVDRTEPFGRPVWAITAKGRRWVDAVEAGTQIQAEIQAEVNP